MSVEGLDKLLRKLNKLGSDSGKVVAKAVSDATKKVQGDAKDLTPVDTGNLRNKIYTRIDEKDGVITGKVYTNVEYAPYVEFGTGQRGKASPSPPKASGDISYREDWAGIPAQPYMYPAMKQNEEYIKDTIKGAIEMEIKKGGVNNV